jgi:hypothetical protein
MNLKLVVQLGNIFCAINLTIGTRIVPLTTQQLRLTVVGATEDGEGEEEGETRRYFYL